MTMRSVAGKRVTLVLSSYFQSNIFVPGILAGEQFNHPRLAAATAFLTDFLANITVITQ